MKCDILYDFSVGWPNLTLKPLRWWNKLTKKIVWMGWRYFNSIRHWKKVENLPNFFLLLADQLLFQIRSIQLPSRPWCKRSLYDSSSICQYQELVVWYRFNFKRKMSIDERLYSVGTTKVNKWTDVRPNKRLKRIKSDA